MSYVDGFLVPVKKAHLEQYRVLAEKMRDKWLKLGALEYVECVADDAPMGEVTSFPRAVKQEDDEVVIFSWITYKSRADRDRIQAVIMEDPEMKNADPASYPFDAKRMVMGGFKPIVGLR